MEVLTLDNKKLSYLITNIAPRECTGQNISFITLGGLYHKQTIGEMSTRLKFTLYTTNENAESLSKHFTKAINVKIKTKDKEEIASIENLSDFKIALHGHRTLFQADVSLIVQG